MPQQEYYPLPTEYLFLPELDLALWDFLYYKAAQNDSWAVFSRAEVYHDPRLIRNRQNLPRWLNTQQSKGIIKIDQESTEDSKRQYLIEIKDYATKILNHIQKPLTFHQNGWVYELASTEEQWLLNLFLLHDQSNSQPLSLPKLQEVLTNIAPLSNKNLQQLTNSLDSLVKLQLITKDHQNKTFYLNRPGFLQPAGVRYQERIRDDLSVQCKLIVEHLSQALSQPISSQEEVVELIRYWHQIGGLRQREFVNAYNQLTSAQDIDLKKLKAELEKRTRNPRDLTTSYALVLRDFQKLQGKALPEFSNQLKLRLDHHTLVGGSFYFDPPRIKRPMSLTLGTIPRWPIRHFPLQNEQLTLLIWVEGHEPIKVAKLSSDRPTPLSTSLMDKLPARYNLASPLTLLIQSPRPLEGLTVNAKLEVRWD